ncbi:MAG: DHH family phosphoesterase [Nanoarchaeota archaeon]|nr:DHH family phosphoesterase [Nanoarchaeota archaeon]
MTKEGDSLEIEIEDKVKKFLEIEKEIQVISHFDTDGITSAVIMTKTLKKLDKKFSVKILKRIEEDTIKNLPKDKLIIFLDLGSGSLNELSASGIENIFIIDHHEVIQEIPKNVHIINPELNGKEKISSSGLTYLFCRKINPSNKELAKLAILGMIGDLLESNIEKMNNEILKDGEMKRKRGLLIYPSTRPLNRVLEYCSDPFIPGVTGNPEGVLELLREVNLSSNGKIKSLMELDEQEMSRLVTAIMLRNPEAKNKKIVGDIFLINFFGQLEDARELSATINACSRLDDTGLALQFCMEAPPAKKKAEYLHAKYRQSLVSGLKFVSEMEKIQGNGFVIINTKNKIKDTMIGTIASILANSSIYPEATVITTLAYYENKIKVSMRSVGENPRNLREILNDIVEKVGGNVGGHDAAAGCMILQEKESEFIDLLKKSFEVEMVKV